MLEHLKEVNTVPIYSVKSENFKTFGKVLEGYDWSGAKKFLEEETLVPEEGNLYVASVPQLEELDIKRELSATVYGGMPIQIGYCNGRNKTYNGFEYHKGSEVNVALTDLVLVLGHAYDMEENCFRVEQATVFFVPEGTAVELYQTTLHLSPLRVSDDGYKALVVLPKGTNTPLTQEEKETSNNAKDREQRLLMQRNKWVISHPDREPLMKQGAFPGLIGENKEIFY